MLEHCTKLQKTPILTVPFSSDCALYIHSFVILFTLYCIVDIGSLRILFFIFPCSQSKVQSYVLITSSINCFLLSLRSCFSMFISRLQDSESVCKW